MPAAGAELERVLVSGHGRDRLERFAGTGRRSSSPEQRRASAGPPPSAWPPRAPRSLAVDIDAEGARSAPSTRPTPTRRHGGEVIAHVADISDEAAAAEAVAAARRARRGASTWLANIAGMLRAVRTHECDLEHVEPGHPGQPHRHLPHVPGRAPPPDRDHGRHRQLGLDLVGSSATRGWPPTPPPRAAIAALTQHPRRRVRQAGRAGQRHRPRQRAHGITNSLDFPDDLTKAESELVRRIMSPTGFGEPEPTWPRWWPCCASDDGAHITGEVIRIDGGTHA